MSLEGVEDADAGAVKGRQLETECSRSYRWGMWNHHQTISGKHNKGPSKECTEEYHKSPGDSGISLLSLTSKKAHSSGFASPWTWYSCSLGREAGRPLLVMKIKKEYHTWNSFAPHRVEGSQLLRWLLGHQGKFYVLWLCVCSQILGIISDHKPIAET